MRHFWTSPNYCIITSHKTATCSMPAATIIFVPIKTKKRKNGQFTSLRPPFCIMCISCIENRKMKTLLQMTTIDILKIITYERISCAFSRVHQYFIMLRAKHYKLIVYWSMKMTISGDLLLPFVCHISLQKNKLTDIYIRCIESSWIEPLYKYILPTNKEIKIIINLCRTLLQSSLT